MLVLGHRGAPRQARENTLASFSRALELGADGVELDVRMTLDERLVLRHDDGFPRGGAVSGLTLDEVLVLEPEAPSLGDALEVLAPALTVVEMKSQPGRNERFVELVAAQLAGRSQATTVSSFDPTLLRRMRVLLPEQRTALLVGVVAGPEQAGATIAEAVEAGHVQIHVERRILLGHLGPDLVDRSVAAGVEVVAWTVNRTDDAAALRDAGLRGVITDVPDEILALRAR